MGRYKPKDGLDNKLYEALGAYHCVISNEVAHNLFMNKGEIDIYVLT